MDLLPDEVLLEIFDSHVSRACLRDIDAWIRLIHVCRRWRNVVLCSSHRLNLRLCCTDSKPVRKLLGIWPTFLPIVIWSGGNLLEREADNVVTVLEQTDRVLEISFEEIASSTWELLSASMHGPFPVLTTLEIRLGDKHTFFPEPFLEGSAPCLRSLDLYGISFSEIHKLLLSATSLVKLSLDDVPRLVSPDMFATYLSSMTKLESITLCFRLAQYHPPHEPQQSPPQQRVILPALTFLGLEAAPGYSEDLMAHLYAPRLEKVTKLYSDSRFDAGDDDLDYLIQLQRG
jgi:hypothetical protein